MLYSSNVNDVERKLTLTAVDYTVGARDKTLKKQMTTALKKFVRKQPTAGSCDDGIKFDEAMCARFERVMIARGWSKPSGSANSSIYVIFCSVPEHMWQ